jgi:tRNA threonylcarbamoyladenosine biosynthesis protein TsaB
MLILAIDTSTRTGSAALLRDTEVIAEVSGYEEAPYSSRLFRDVALLQDRAGFRIHEIDVFAVAAGPGSFTGLRVGLTAVKAWAEVHRKPIAAISGLEAIAAECPDGGAANPYGAVPGFLAPFLDARRGQIFGAIYRRIAGDSAGLSLDSDESILSVDEFLQLVKGKPAGLVQLVSPTPEVLPADRLQEIIPGAWIVPVSGALAPAIGRLGFERAKRGDLVDAIRLDANYVRRSDAESKWKEG